MPHVASPSQLFAAELRTRLREVQRAGVAITCAGLPHLVSFDGRSLHADDHDEAAEAVLAAVGGTRPCCLAVVDGLHAAAPAELWAALTGTSPDDDVLRSVPSFVLRSFLARALRDEFASAGLAVRDSVGQLGLALLGTADDQLDRLADKFRLTRQFPRWDPGPGPWSDRELVLLSRCVRARPGEPVPHLELLPSDPLARRAVAKYARSLLDESRVHSTEELRERLAPTFRNVRALTALLVSEGLLEQADGRYRVGAPKRRRSADG